LHSEKLAASTFAPGLATAEEIRSVSSPPSAQLLPSALVTKANVTMPSQLVPLLPARFAGARRRRDRGADRLRVAAFGLVLL
jgi:hypothetical protein